MNEVVGKNKLRAKGVSRVKTRMNLCFASECEFYERNKYDCALKQIEISWNGKCQLYRKKKKS